MVMVMVFSLRLTSVRTIWDSLSKRVEPPPSPNQLLPKRPLPLRYHPKHSIASIARLTAHT